MIKVSYLARAGLALIIVLTGLGVMVYQNQAARSGGHEVVLQTNPIDPRDVFFGHYAILNYRDFRRSDFGLNWQEDQSLEDGQAIYVALVPSEVFSEAGRAYRSLAEAQASNTPFVKATLEIRYRTEDGQRVWRNYRARFDLPSQYFADPDTAIELQNRFRDANTMRAERETWERCIALSALSQAEVDNDYVCSQLDLSDEPSADIPEYGAIVSVSDTGETVIKGLYLDGEYIYDTLTGPRLVLEGEG